MKVLLVSNGFQPNYEKGFANGLAVNGVKVVLVSSDRTLVDNLHPGVSAVNLRGSQDPRRPAWIKAANIVRYSSSLVSHIRSGRYDVVHLIGLYMTRSVFAGYLECLAYRLLAKRFFMTVHNLLPHDRHSWFHRIMHRVIYRLPYRLVVHTEKMKTNLVEHFGIAASCIIVMAHGVDSVPEKLSVPAPMATLRVLIFGSLSRYKGLDLLLSALANCQDIPIAITVVGESRDAVYEDEIRHLIGEVSAQHTVHWEPGFVREETMQWYFESADVVALPYREIDQSGVLFTAFRFGTPVMATDVGSFRESLPQFAGIICGDSNALSLAYGLREFYAKRYTFDRSRIQDYGRSLRWPLTVSSVISAYGEATSA